MEDNNIGGVLVTYRELLDMMKARPDSFWSGEQRKKALEIRYRQWVEKQNEKYDAMAKAMKKKK